MAIYGTFLYGDELYGVAIRAAITSVGATAQYQVRLKDQSGNVVAIFDDWRSMTYTHVVNDRGTIRFEMNGQDSRIGLFELDGQIEVWRRSMSIDLDWYLEWEGFFRTSNDLYQQNDKNSFVAYGFSYLDLANRGHVMWPAGSNEATKNNVAETVMKELVNENIGASALATSGRQENNTKPGLTIQADIAAGPTYDNSMENKNLLVLLKEIGLFTVQNNDVIDYDIIGTGTTTFEFRTYAGQRGTDHTQGNSDGNDPVVFALGFGNMIVPILSKNRSREITAMYAIGRGTDSAQQISTVTSTGLSDSPWNRIEGVVNTSTSGEDQSDQLTAAAEAELEKHTLDEKLSFRVLQIPNTFYGKHYTWGDLVTVQYKDSTFSKKLVRVRVTVSARTEGEEINIEFADK